MADSEQREPDSEQHESDDELAADLRKQIRANQALLDGMKYDLGQQVLAAQQGGGEMPSPFEFAQVKSIETAITNDRTFLEARELTRG